MSQPDLNSTNKLDFNSITSIFSCKEAYESCLANRKIPAFYNHGNKPEIQPFFCFNNDVKTSLVPINSIGSRTASADGTLGPKQKRLRGPQYSSSNQMFVTTEKGSQNDQSGNLIYFLLNFEKYISNDSINSY